MPTKSPFWVGRSVHGRGVSSALAERPVMPSTQDCVRGSGPSRRVPASPPADHLERDGRQYVTVLSCSATVYAALAADPDVANVPAGGSVGPSRCPRTMSTARRPKGSSRWRDRRRP